MNTTRRTNSLHIIQLLTYKALTSNHIRFLWCLSSVCNLPSSHLRITWRLSYVLSLPPSHVRIDIYHSNFAYFSAISLSPCVFVLLGQVSHVVCFQHTSKALYKHQRNLIWFEVNALYVKSSIMWSELVPRMVFICW
jgi:hypothetical protein